MLKVILVGYMGSGKTTVGQLLSRKMQIPVYDLDQVIEEKESTTVSGIFSAKGEIYFRKQEHLSFKEILSLPHDLILSLGGGTPCYANNHELLNGNGHVSVYLKASINTLVQRLQFSRDRPLLEQMDDEEQNEFIAKHLFDRSYYYNQATFTVSTDGKSPDEIADTILGLLT